MKGYIYKITNTKTNRVYIGSTSNATRRKNEHFRRLEQGCHHSKHLQLSYSKYGKENFKFEILVSFNEVDKNKLFELERYYIIEYNSADPLFGYNMTTVTDIGGCEYSEAQKLEKSLNSEFSKPVLMINHNGDVVNEFHSIGFASREISASLAQVQVTMHNKNKTCKGHKFIFKSEYDVNKNYSFEMYSRNEKRSGKKINQYSFDGKYVKTFTKISEAASEIMVDNACISCAINGIQKSAGGYIWKRTTGDNCRDLTIEELSEYNITNNGIGGKKMNRIQQYTKNGELVTEYKNAKFLPSEFKLRDIYKCFYGGRKSYKGFVWKKC